MRATPVASFIDNLPPSLRSLWNLENELRSALQNAVFMRKDEANRHMAEAKRHLEDALGSIKKSGVAGKGEAPPADEKLNYGEGPRADYGEGYKYRKEELSKGADQSTEHTWSGGDHDQDSKPVTNTGHETEPDKAS